MHIKNTFSIIQKKISDMFAKKKTQKNEFYNQEQKTSKKMQNHCGQNLLTSIQMNVKSHTLYFSFNSNNTNAADFILPASISA